VSATFSSSTPVSGSRAGEPRSPTHAAVGERASRQGALAAERDGGARERPQRGVLRGPRRPTRRAGARARRARRGRQRQSAAPVPANASARRRRWTRTRRRASKATRPAQDAALRPLAGAAVALGGEGALRDGRLAYRRCGRRPRLAGPASPTRRQTREVALTAAPLGGASLPHGGARYNLLLAAFDDEQAALRVRASAGSGSASRWPTSRLVRRRLDLGTCSLGAYGLAAATSCSWRRAQALRARVRAALRGRPRRAADAARWPAAQRGLAGGARAGRAPRGYFDGGFGGRRRARSVGALGGARARRARRTPHGPWARPAGGRTRASSWARRRGRYGWARASPAPARRGQRRHVLRGQYGASPSSSWSVADDGSTCLGAAVAVRARRGGRGLATAADGGPGAHAGPPDGGAAAARAVPGGPPFAVASPLIFPAQQLPLASTTRGTSGSGARCEACHVAAATSTSAATTHPAERLRSCHEIDRAEPRKAVPAAPRRRAATCHVSEAGAAGCRRRRPPRRRVRSPTQPEVQPPLHVGRGVGCGSATGRSPWRARTRATAHDGALPGCHDGKRPQPLRRVCTSRSRRAPAHELASRDGGTASAAGSGKLVPSACCGLRRARADLRSGPRRRAQARRRLLPVVPQARRVRRLPRRTVRPFDIHPSDYVSLHGSDARRNTPDCSTCHRAQSFCVGCTARGVAADAMGGVPGCRRATVRAGTQLKSFHPPGW